MRSLRRLLAATPHQGGDLRLHPVAPDVFLYRGYFSNSAVLLLPRSVLVVDSQVTPRAAQPLLEQLRAITDRPVRHVFNTHYHGDHVGGNAAFAGAEILASARTARFMVERADERLAYARTFGLEIEEVPPPVPPARTFDERLELTIDGERLELFRAGQVETPDASVLWWPARRVLAAGDGVATAGYPFLGVPFLDEGLRDDGEWTGFLGRLRALAPRVLLPGHGPALAGEKKIAARLDLLSGLMRDLLQATRAEVAGRVAGELPTAQGDPGSTSRLTELVARIDRRLARYARRPDLEQSVATQRFAIYRALNGSLPGRQGKGWWHDLRPSAIALATPAEADAELARFAHHGSARPGKKGSATPAPAARTADRARDRYGLPAAGAGGARKTDPGDPHALPAAHALHLARRGRRDLAIALVERWLEHYRPTAAAHDVLSELYFAGAQDVPSKIDATDYVRAAARAARAALALDPRAPFAQLNFGTIEILSALIAGQDPARGAQRVTAALASPALDAGQRRRARFALAKAHQAAFRPDDADQELRGLLPAWARPLFPLLRARLRSLP